jgi:hypothetical protein
MARPSAGQCGSQIASRAAVLFPQIAETSWANAERAQSFGCMLDAGISLGVIADAQIPDPGDPSIIAIA